MKRITLGFKAFDAHELLCHFVAVEAGLYERADLAVDLADITFVADNELPDDWYQASCGAALASALRGFGQKVVLVAVDRPMFWIWSRDPMTGITGLSGGRLATFPAVAPPHQLANVVLRRAGLDPGQDVRLMPARDDTARLGLLRSGSADAAVISSAIPPARLAALGLHRLCCIGDELRLPTTGLAVSGAHLQTAAEEARALAAAHRASLAVIHENPAQTAAVLGGWFEIGTELARETALLYATAFTTDGRTPAAIASGAIEALGKSLQVASLPAWTEVYEFL